MRIRDGSIPLLDRHLERLVSSCPQANLMPPAGDLRGSAEGHALRPPADRVLRMTWNGAAVQWDDREYVPVRSLTLATVAVPHPGYRIKSVERDAFEEAGREAGRAGADEPLLLTAQQEVTEAARWALAWFDGDVVFMPDLRLGILPSIGRIRVLELLDARGWQAEHGQYHRQILDGRSIFVMNAVRGVVPVTQLDGRQLPVDARVAELADAFWPA